jgi:8-oxo-dGTP pyrophosphatase MutT (NUDIX family)
VDEIKDVQRALERPAVERDGPGLKRAAVAAVFTPGRRLWFMRRAERLGDPWSGHLSFPGGREQPEDPSLHHVALRETREEVGVDLQGAHYLGRLDDLRSRPLPDLVVRPFVFALDHEPEFITNHEVAGLHTCTLDALLAGQGRGVMRWPVPGIGMRLPCVDLDGVRLWGMTLAIVDDLLHRIDQRGLGLDRNR